LTASYFSAQAAVESPGSQSRSLVLARDAAWVAMLPTLREYYGRVRVSLSVADADKALLGMNVRRAGSTIHAPTTPPTCSVIRRWGGNVLVQFSDPTSASKRRKPNGAVGLVIYTAVAHVPETLAGWTRRGMVGATRVTIAFDPTLPPGTKVFVRACWQTQTGKTSPAGEPTEAIIDGVGMQMTPETLKMAA